MRFTHLAATALLTLSALPLSAQEDNFTSGVNISDSDLSDADLFVTDTSVLDGLTCIGNGCSDGMTFDNTATLTLQNTITNILFNDTSNSSSPDRDWKLLVNQSSGGDAGERFSIQDLTAGNDPFNVEGGAPDNAMWIASDGNIGLGTVVPTDNIHIEDGTFASILLNRNTSGGFSEASWRVGASNTGMVIADNVTGRSPFIIENGAPTFALQIKGTTGYVGMGPTDPDAALHVQRTDGLAGIVVENTAISPSAVREMFAMKNNGGSFFTLDNTASDTQWFFVHEDAAPNRFIITDGVADGPEMTVTADGDVTIEGNFFANGGSQLNVPDYVFSDDYALRPLAEVARFIDANSHLPEVPSSAQIADEGLNMTAMQMTLLKKVEELTLYTLEQQAEIAELRASVDTLKQ